MKYLLKTTEEYRVSTEEEATQLIDEAKKESGYILQKYGSQYKERKQKGEVIDAYFKVTLVKMFTEEKEPNFQTKVIYEQESAY